MVPITDDTMASSPHTTNFPFPAGLRSMVWGHLGRHLLKPDDNRSTETVDSVTSTASQLTAPVLTDQVGPDGECELFTSSLAADVPLFTEFLGAIAHRTLFVCESPTALANFTDRLVTFFGGDPGAVPGIRVEMHFFKDSEFENAERLSDWREVQRAHGLDLHVEDYMTEWRDAGQTLPGQIKVDVFMHRPWRDYRTLFKLTIPLRQRDVRVRVDRSAWMSVPDSDFHIALNVASITAVRLARQSDISVDEAQGLCDHGCRGFRMDWAMGTRTFPLSWE